MTARHVFLLSAAALLALAPGVPEAAQEGTQVELVTSEGTIVLELDAAAAPKTVANFLRYVGEGHYDGTIFHRVIDGFMIQGGGFDRELNKLSTHEPIENEADNGLKNTRGTIAMARTGDPHSATAQFFINTVDNVSLDHTGKSMQGWGYAVFGKVVQGMDVVDAIAAVSTGRAGGMADVPAEPLVIEKANRR
ncbi:MAG: peptidylprolyl isomerase [Thermoanaerobaculia bacterium]